MELKWYGTASLALRQGERTLVFDPYLKRLNPQLPPLPQAEIRQAEAIFITHPHIDHFSDIDAVAAAGGPPVYVNERGVELARRQGLSCEIREIRAGQELCCGPFRIRALAARHVRFDRRLVLQTVGRCLVSGKFSQVGEFIRLSRRFKIQPTDVLAYLVSGGGCSVLVLGSAGLDPSVSYPAPDWLVFPYQGRSRMAPYAADLLEALHPGRVLLDHFDDAFPPVSQTMDGRELISLLQSRGSSLEVTIPKEGQWLRL